MHTPINITYRRLSTVKRHLLLAIAIGFFFATNASAVLVWVPPRTAKQTIQVEEQKWVEGRYDPEPQWVAETGHWEDVVIGRSCTVITVEVWQDSISGPVLITTYEEQIWSDIVLPTWIVDGPAHLDPGVYIPGHWETVLVDREVDVIVADGYWMDDGT